MKKVLLIMILFATSIFSNNQDTIEYLFGPRTGFTGIVTENAKFNEKMQALFPNEEKDYNPFITQFGINFEQRVKLGDTNSHFAFQEVILIGGLDQSLVIPSLSFLIGYRHGAGLEIGLGPNISITSDSAGNLKGSISVAYTLGWTFSYKGVYVPVNIAFVPTPVDGSPRLSLLTGFNFFY